MSKYNQVDQAFDQELTNLEKNSETQTKTTTQGVDVVVKSKSGSSTVLSIVAILISLGAICFTGYTYSQFASVDKQSNTLATNDLDSIKSQIVELVKVNAKLQAENEKLANIQSSTDSQISQQQSLINQLTQTILQGQKEIDDVKSKEAVTQNFSTALAKQLLVAKIQEIKDALVYGNNIKLGKILLQQSLLIASALPENQAQVYSEVIQKDIIQLSLYNQNLKDELVEKLVRLESRVNKLVLKKSQDVIEPQNNEEKSINNFLKKFVQLTKSDSNLLSSDQDKNLVQLKILFKIDLLQTAVLSNNQELFEATKSSVIELINTYYDSQVGVNSQFITDLSKIEFVKLDFSNLKSFNIAQEN